jgi:DNA-binding CsgD family transcriptional regulator
MSSKQIAVELAISPRTAETHRANVMSKLEFHGVADLVRFAIREGFVTA